MEMRGIHINWTKPLTVRKKAVNVEDFELMTTVLSALQFRKLYGRIELYTDQNGYRFYESIGFLPLWDAVHPLEVPDTVDANAFWAAGKLYALRQVKAPVCMIDTDFILWQKITPTAPFMAAHTEAVGNTVYPSDLKTYDTAYEPFYAMPADAPAYNTACLFFTDEGFKNTYLDAACAFMEQTDAHGDTLVPMVCAEQRILGMTAKLYGITPQCILPNGPERKQEICSHTWGFKQKMREDAAKRAAFCLRLAMRIAKESPEWAIRCADVEILQQYFHPLRQPIDV